MAFLLAHCFLLAQEKGGGGGAYQMLPALVVLVAVFYIMFIRPQNKEQSQRKQMIAALKKNDRVVTIGGIKGKVANVHAEADEVTLLVDENSNTRLRLTMAAIARVVGEDPSTDEAAKS